MPTQDQFIQINFGGGFATDFGPTAAIQQSGDMYTVPFLAKAENCIFTLDGGTRKAPGTVLHGAQLETGTNVMGIFDYWRMGTGGTPSQQRIVHVGSKVKKDDADGSYSDIITGLTAGAVPCYAVLEDLLVMCSTATSDGPRKWDGSSAGTLGGSPPNFSIVTEHKNRLWAAGNPALPSRLYYCELLDPEDWSGSGAGHIDISPNDGDRITGLATFNNDLFVFKGPYKGSIHRITGSSPTGGDAFARQTFVKGIGAVNHQSICHFGNDLAFLWSDGAVHSLTAVEAYSDYRKAALTFPIQRDYIQTITAFNSLDKVWAVDWPDFGVVLFAVPVNSSTTPNQIWMMDYRFDPVRWATWPAWTTQANCLALVVDSETDNLRRPFGGGTDGYVRKYGQSARSLDAATSISYAVKTPHLRIGSPIMMKTFLGGCVAFRPRFDSDVTIGWELDDRTQQTRTVSQGGGAGLGSFVLGTNKLGGGKLKYQFFETDSAAEGGEFRTLALEVKNNALNEDVEPHSLGIDVAGGARSWEN